MTRTIGEFEKRIRSKRKDWLTSPTTIVCPHDTIDECDCNKDIQWLISLFDEARREFPTYSKVANFREKHFLYSYTMDSLFISIVSEWAWKYLGLNIFTFEKRQSKPEIKKWFEEND